MKILSNLINIAIGIGVLFTLIASVGSAITKEPVLLSVIRSNSMVPVWERGDMVVIKNLSETEPVKNGDIIFFKAEEGNLASKGWIAHRVIEGNEKEGFITKGDANEDPDQPAIQRDWIAGRAFTIGEHPIVIPKLGYLSLWLEKYQSNPYILPAVAVILAVIVGISELTSGQKRHKKKSGVELQLIYIFAGLTVAVMLAATMISSSQRFNVPYQVTEDSQGIIMGSAIGVLKVGDEVTKPLTQLSNGGVFNLIATVTTNDEQIQFSDAKVTLRPSEKIDAEFTVMAKKTGKYESFMQVGLFYPFLPSSFIYFLASKSYWLALVVVSLLPALPFMMYPFLDGKMRRGILAFMRKRKNKLVSKLPF